MIQLFSMVSFFAYTCPNRSGADVIDNPDRFEQIFGQYDIPEDPEKKISRTTFRWWTIRKCSFLVFQRIL